MPKKESAKRGYMTPEEIEEHIKGLKTNEGKIGYLAKILKKEKLLTPTTKDYIHNVSDKYAKEYLERAEEHKERGYRAALRANDPLHGKYLTNLATEEFFNAAENYLKANKINKARNLVDSLVRMGYKSQAEQLREKIEAESKKEGGLSSKLTGIISIVGILGSLFFLSPNITGNAIGASVRSDSNLMGILLFVVGIAAGFFYLRRSK